MTRLCLPLARSIGPSAQTGRRCPATNRSENEAAYVLPSRVTNVTGRVSRAGFTSYPESCQETSTCASQDCVPPSSACRSGVRAALSSLTYRNWKVPSGSCAEVAEDRPCAGPEGRGLRVDRVQELGAVLVLDRVGHLLQHRFAGDRPLYAGLGLVGRGRGRLRRLVRSGAVRVGRRVGDVLQPGVPGSGDQADGDAESDLLQDRCERRALRIVGVRLRQVVDRLLSVTSRWDHRQRNRVAVLVDHLGLSLITCPSQAGHPASSDTTTSPSNARLRGEPRSR